MPNAASGGHREGDGGRRGFQGFAWKTDQNRHVVCLPSASKVASKRRCWRLALSPLRALRP
eukprot:4213818-Prymnesium_polylepis.1